MRKRGCEEGEREREKEEVGNGVRKGITILHTKLMVVKTLHD